MIKIAICEDDNISSTILYEHLEDYIRSHNYICQLDTYDNAEALLDSKKQYDIYFLDMILPGMNGIELGKQIRDYDTEGKIVCISSEQTYAIDSYDVKSCAYLLKPFDLHKLHSILNEIIESIKKDLIIVQTNGGSIKLKPYQITYVDIEGRNLCYHLTNKLTINGKCLRSSFGKAIKHLQDNSNFLFLAPSLLVNLNEIQAVNKESFTLKNNEIVYIAKNKYEVLYDAWINK